jgi:Ca2+-binding RTX toxin-like protein
MTTPVTTDAEFLVNTYTTSNQQTSSLAGLENGGFIITWQSEGQDGAGTEIYGQLYDAAGAADGSEFLINTTTANDQNAPAVAALADGSFVVTWESDVQDGSDYGVYAQRFNADGTVAGSEFLVNTYTSDGQASPQITALKGGGFVVTWESALQDGSVNGIYAQRYDAAGVAAGSEFLVNTTTTGSQDSPSITALDSGGFLVTWSGSDGSGSGINGQLYTSTGVASGSEFVINATTSGDQYIPSTAGLSGGGFVTIWESDGQDGSGAGIYGQRYTSAGVATGSEFLVNTTTSGSQRSGKVTALDDGGFVVTWQSDDGSNNGVYGQLYDSSGVKSGAQFLINTTTSSNQIDANITALSEGGFVVSWTSDLQDGANNGVYAQMFSYAGGEFTSGKDTVTLYGPGQSVKGLGGADTITGADFAGGADIINGNGGNDTLSGRAGDDRLKGGKGNDTIEGGKGDDTLNGGTGVDTASYETATSGVAVSLALGTSQNTLGAGLDTLAKFENLLGSAFADNLNGDDTANQLEGGTGSDTLSGNKGNDKLYGDNGRDTVKGGKGKDKLFGGKGDDELYGGKGNDTLAGNAGKDVFVFKKKGGSDTITDFQNGKDKIDLSAFNFASKSAALAKFYEIGSAGDNKLGFDFKGTDIVIKGIDMGDLNGADILI